MGMDKGVQRRCPRGIAALLSAGPANPDSGLNLSRLDGCRDRAKSLWQGSAERLGPRPVDSPWIDRKIFLTRSERAAGDRWSLRRSWGEAASPDLTSVQ